MADFKFKSFSLNLGGRLVEYSRPQVMGIINVTPDSFYAGSRTPDEDGVKRRAEEMLAGGADMIDLGGYSSRPGADEVSPEEETERVCRGVEALRQVIPAEMPVSVDTFRAAVAKAAIEQAGADIINDIAGGALGEEMFSTVAELGVPYILMHMRGTPQTMQQHTDYPRGVTTEVVVDLAEKLRLLRRIGVADVIVDPGFGFSKTLQQNYQLLAEMKRLEILGCPILVGVSRKSMIYKLTGGTPSESLPGTTAIDTLAVERGASILRVHDVAAARQALDVTLETLKC